MRIRTPSTEIISVCVTRIISLCGAFPIHSLRALLSMVKTLPADSVYENGVVEVSLLHV